MKLICLALCLAAVSANNVDYIPGAYHFNLQKGVEVSAISSFLTGVTLLKDHESKGSHYVRVTGMSGEVANRLRNSPLVSTINQDYYVYLDEIEQVVEDVGTMEHPGNYFEPNACNQQERPAFGNIWHLARMSSDPPVNVNSPYRFMNHGPDGDIYVLDTGIDYDHPDLVGRSYFLMTGQSLIGRGQDDRDFHGHGTHVASLAGGTVFGIAKGARMFNCKVLGDLGFGNGGDIIDGIVDAHHHSNANPSRTGVINMSLGGGAPDATREARINEAVDDGVIIIAAAGNSNADTSTAWPAAYENVIAVGATNINDELASFSNFGALNNVNAPGQNTYAAASQWSSWSEDPACPSRQNCYIAISGTSMACPVVAGQAARRAPPTQQGFKAHLATAGSVHGRVAFVHNPTAGDETPNRLAHKYDC